MKYELSETDVMTADGHKLHRIVYEDGTEGGYAEDYGNIVGDSFVDPDSAVYDGALATGGSRIVKSTVRGGSCVDGGSITGSLIRGHALVESSCLSESRVCEATVKSSRLSKADVGGGSFIRGCDISDSKISDGQTVVDETIRGALTPKRWETAFMRCPEEGAFVAFKKVWCPSLDELVIAKLLIPAKAKRSSAGGSKCRASCAKTIAFYEIGGKRLGRGIVCVSTWDHRTEYKVGAVTNPNGFDPNRWNECSNGIHFFVNRTEAEQYG